MNLKAGFVAGIVIFIIMMLGGTLCQMIFNYDATAIPGMRNINDPFIFLFFLNPFLIGFIMAYVYPKFTVKDGKEFGLIIWLIYILPSAFIVFTAMNYPLGFTINQLVGGLIELLAAGMVIEKLSKN